MNKLHDFCIKWAYLFKEDAEPSKEEIELFHKERNELNIGYIEVIDYLYDNIL